MFSFPFQGAGENVLEQKEKTSHTLNTTVQSCANPDIYTKGACRLYPHTAGQFYPHTYPHLLFIGHIYCARSGCVTCAWIAARDRRAFQAQAGPKEEHLTKGMLVSRILSLDLLMSLLYFSKENIPSFLPHGFDPKPIVVGGSLSRDCNQLWMTPLSRTVMFFQLFMDRSTIANPKSASSQSSLGTATQLLFGKCCLQVLIQSQHPVR